MVHLHTTCYTLQTTLPNGPFSYSRSHNIVYAIDMDDINYTSTFDLGKLTSATLITWIQSSNDFVITVG